MHAVLVTFRRPDGLAAMLRVLGELDALTGELVVVDNSPDEANRALVASIDGMSVRYLPMDDNTGPAGGLAAGVAALVAHADDHDWILFLDDDNPPAERSIVPELHRTGEALVASGAPVGAVGMVGVRFDRSKGEMVRLADRDLEGMVAVDAIGGGHLPLYRVAALRAVGGPRAALFFGYDDVELGLRLRAAGYQVLVPGELWLDSRRRHPRSSEGMVTGRFLVAPWRTYYSVRNQVVLAAEYAGPLAVTRLLAKECVVRPILNLGRAGSIGQTLLTWRGVADGLRRRLGRRVEPVVAKAAG